jgi:hypothetical protein
MDRKATKKIECLRHHKTSRSSGNDSRYKAKAVSKRKEFLLFHFLEVLEITAWHEFDYLAWLKRHFSPCLHPLPDAKLRQSFFP